MLNELSTNQDDIIKNIQTFTDRFGFQESDVRKKIQTDNIFAAHFTKEPWRQGFHEKVAAEWIEELETVKAFETLKKRGRNAYYVTNHGFQPIPSVAFRPTHASTNRLSTAATGSGG